ncbi:50S ribosomal protein L18e [Candidatus Woesearchaeota archaeon]|nr:50S ribosomal protein L18e [Candidatus Woesearchaeota archaeon]
MEKSNMQLNALIHELKKVSTLENVGLWKALAADLERPSRQRRAVNLSRISRVANENEIVIVPGKVLASGELTQKVTIAAFKFSKQAMDKITKKGKAITIMDLLRENPRGKNARIIG